MSYIAAEGEQSSSIEISTLTNLTVLGNGFVKKTGTNTFEIGTVDEVIPSSITESENGIYRVFDFGTMPVKIKVKNVSGGGYTYLTFQDGQIIASDS